MITNFFVLSPRGDTVIAKTYRSKSGVAAHERSQTEAFFRKVKFWDGVAPGTPGMDTTLGLGSSNSNQASGGGEVGEGENGSKESVKRFGDAPPIFVMPDGYSYMHVKRNGLIFGCATEKNVSPVVVIEVSLFVVRLCVIYCIVNVSIFAHKICSFFIVVSRDKKALIKDCKGLQRLLWYSIRRVHS